MNIITRTKNNLIYAYHLKRATVAIAKMKKHRDDPDDSKFKKWSEIGFKSIKASSSIPLDRRLRP